MSEYQRIAFRAIDGQVNCRCSIAPSHGASLAGVVARSSGVAPLSRIAACLCGMTRS